MGFNKGLLVSLILRNYYFILISYVNVPISTIVLKFCFEK